MSTTTTIRRYRVETLVFTNNADKVRLTSVVDARLDLCENEIQIGTYAIDHFKNMLKDELDKLDKNSTKRKLINEVIKIVKQEEKNTGRSHLNIFLNVYREDENGKSYEDEEVSDNEKNERFEVNPFENEVENWIDYEIS
jgi:hypothetical protein